MKNATNLTLEDKIYFLLEGSVEVISTAILSISFEKSKIKVETKSGYAPLFDTQKDLKTCSESLEEASTVYFTTDHKKALEKSNERVDAKKSELLREIEKLGVISKSNVEKISSLNEK